MSGWSRGSALVLGSLGLHLLALATVPALLSRDSRSPLFVDLAGPDELADPVGALARASSESGPRPSARGDGSARASAPAARLKPAPLPAPAVPSAAVSPPAPPAPGMAAVPTAPPPSAPTAALPAPVPPPTPSGATSTPDASAPGPSATAGGAAQGDAGPVASGPRGGATSGGELTSGGSASGAPGHGGALLAFALPGEGRGGVPAEYAPYLARFRQRVEEALVYPLAARRQGHGGRVELEVLLEPSGRVGRVEVARSSSNAALDEAAVDAVRAIKPIPFPDGLPRRPVLVRLPLVFQLR